MSHLTTLLLVAGALLPCAVGAKAANAKAPTRGPSSHDLHLHCDLSKAQTGVWHPAGISDLPPEIAGQFKLLGSLHTQSDFSHWKEACPKLPDKLARIVSPARGGNVSSAELVVATRDVSIYRAYSRPQIACGVERPAGAFGSWWSLIPLPVASKRVEYRAHMAVCEPWNDFSKRVTCTLKKGSVIAVGPTQSADCTSDNQARVAEAGCRDVVGHWPKTYSASSHHQAYLNLFGRDAERAAFLANCTEGEWH